ncbi:hypothetical protein M3Y97_01128500 [Aphelenchoides bicaudatus]|nr:hypothetical protein M3Y97_01128500 [Aphelenchoides bicaudatus]
MMEWKSLLLVGLVFMVGVESRPHGFPPALVFNLFPRSIIATALQMTPKQRLNFARLYVKYKQNSQETDEELEAKMFEELKENDKPLFELMWPAIMEIKVRMGRMNDEAKVFFEEYMQKANEGRSAASKTQRSRCSKASQICCEQLRPNRFNC